MSITQILIGLDDTDNLESRGTGRLARQIAAELMQDFDLLGVTRHQLLVDPRIPYTSHNSSAAIAISSSRPVDLEELMGRVQKLMLDDFQAGSDPGLCVLEAQVGLQLIEFGKRAQNELVNQAEAFSTASSAGIRLAGLGGSNDGVIGALAAAGLAACGEDGRYLLVGNSRDLFGLHPVSDIVSAGIAEVRTLQGKLVNEGDVLADKVRPARRGGRPVLFVEKNGDHWQPLKLG